MTMAAPSLESVLNRLRGTGLRISTPRRVVVRTLLEAEAPMTATEIAEADGSAALLDLATVYRNLEALEERELAVRVQAGDGAARWRLATEAGQGYVACHRCGALEEMETEELDDLAEALQVRLGYQLSFTRFPLTGICSDCASTTASGPDGLSRRPKTARRDARVQAGCGGCGSC